MNQEDRMKVEEHRQSVEEPAEEAAAVEDAIGMTKPERPPEFVRKAKYHPKIQ